LDFLLALDFITQKTDYQILKTGSLCKIKRQQKQTFPSEGNNSVLGKLFCRFVTAR